MRKDVKMIRKPDNRSRPSRHDAVRDPYLAGVRQREAERTRKQGEARRKFRKNWATTSTWSLPVATVAKWVAIMIAALLAAPYIFQAIAR